MSSLRRVSVGLAFLLLQGIPVHAQVEHPDPGYSRSFECPESLWTSWGRDRADMRYVTWAQETHPDWSIDQLLEYRMDLLRSHGCTETLEAIENGTIERQVEAEAANERRAGVVIIGGGALAFWVVLRRRRSNSRPLG